MSAKKIDDAHAFPYQTLGEVFRKVMEREQIKTYDEMGKIVQMSDVTIGRICNDQQHVMKPENLVLFAERFRLPVGPLLLLNAVHALPDKIKSRVEVERGFFDALTREDAADLGTLPAFSDIRLPLSVWRQEKKKGRSAAEILADHANLESDVEGLDGKFLKGDRFLFRFQGIHMLSTTPEAKIVPPGSFLLVREVDEAELHNGDLVLVQFMPAGRHKAVESAQVYIYGRRHKDGYLYETYRCSNPDPSFAARVRHTGKFGERNIQETRIIYGKVIRIVDHRY